MKVSCPSCQSTLSIDDKKIPAGGARIKCPTCQTVFPVKAPVSGASGVVPLPGAAGSTGPTSTVPLPGLSARPPAPGAWQDEATRAGVGLESGPSGAIPLPGGIPGATAVVAPPSNARGRASGAVPLPGLRAPVPERTQGRDEATRVGAATSTTSSIFDLDIEDAAAAERRGSGAIPLPPASLDASVRGREDAVALPGSAAARSGSRPSSAGSAIGLPGRAEPESFEFDVSGPSGLRSQPSFTGIAPPPPAAFSFDTLPAPARQAAPGSFDFSTAAAPATRGSPSFEFDIPDASQPPALAAISFGEVDLGGGPGSPRASDLEFDPGASSRAAPDDLEADLSAPIPAPAAPTGPTDGLEMLSFIDDQAKEAGAKADGPSQVRRFHIRRRSGKVFGPFEEAVIVKMLEEGQLLGNEEVSLDTETWQPVGGEAAFQSVIARLMEAPSQQNGQGPSPAQDERAKGPSMERLKALYEGRMAAVAVVQSKEPVPFRKRLPWILGGAALAAVLTAGISLGVATPYGFFGLKLLFPARVRADTREFAYLQAARQGFLTGTWKAFRSAREQAGQALAINEFPEARAVWCQAVFYLDRRYGKAPPSEVEEARAELVNVKLLGEKSPEVLKTLAADALDRKAPDEALAFINDALARDSEDLESYFLRSEVFLQKKQTQQARAELEQVLKRADKAPKRLGAARALHALGLLSRSLNEPAEARFTQALEADPGHLASALELAELAIITQKDVPKGMRFLDRALTKEAAEVLSTAELGKALALKAETLVVLGKIQDAVPLFEQALKADPGNAFTQARLGRVYLELHDPDRAVALLQKAVTSTPESLDYAAGYLSALIAVGRMDDARKMVQQVTTRFPGNAILAYLSGRVSDALDNPKEAEEAYKRALAADPTIADAYLYLARLFMRFRRFTEARPQLEAGLEKAPDNASLRMGMGELAFLERDLDRAEKEFTSAVGLDASLAEAHLGLSRVSLERSKPQLAETQVERALEINPRITGGKLQQGIALWKLGRLGDAIAVLEKAREDEPRNLQVRVTLGAVAFEKGDLDGALKYLNSALVAEPGHPDGNFYLARVQNAQRNHTQAIEAMKRALDFNGTNPVYHYWMGRIYADARKGDDAVAEWKSALALDDDYADALEALGKAYFERSDFKRAVKNYEAALKADPARASVRLEIGDAQMKQDDWDGAIASYAKALEADPGLKSAYFQMGQAYEEKKQPRRAIEQYLKATTADDQNAEAWRQLGWLYKSTARRKDAAGAFRHYLALRPQAEDKKQIEDELEFLK